MRYYYSPKANETAGPVEAAELNQLAATGAIDDSTPVIAEGQQIWTTYGAIRHGESTRAAADAVAAGVNRAAASLRQFSWGSFFFGILLSLLGWFTLPWAVFVSACRELATWGRDRTLPTGTSDMPIMTFLAIVVRNIVIVVVALTNTVLSVLVLFGNGPLHKGYGWNATSAFGGFAFSLLAGYFSLIVVAFGFEVFAWGVRVANDLKKIAQR